jgi:hypothetical protein
MRWNYLFWTSWECCLYPFDSLDLTHSLLFHLASLPPQTSGMVNAVDLRAEIPHREWWLVTACLSIVSPLLGSSVWALHHNIWHNIWGHHNSHFSVIIPDHIYIWIFYFMWHILVIASAAHLMQVGSASDARRQRTWCAFDMVKAEISGCSPCICSASAALLHCWCASAAFCVYRVHF